MRQASTPRRLRTRLSRPHFWVGAAAVALAAGAWMQISWLRGVTESYPEAYRSLLGRRLEQVSRDLEDAARARALAALDVPSRAIRPDEPEDDVAPFAGAADEGVRFYYLYSFREGDHGPMKVTAWDPSAGKALPTGPGTPHYNRALRGSTMWIFPIATRQVVDPARLETMLVTSDEIAISRAVVDERARAVGVAGAVVDADYFRAVQLPADLSAAVERAFPPEERGRVRVRVVDGEGRPMAVPGPEGGERQASVAFRFPFRDWEVVAESVGLTPEAEARRQLLVGIAQLVLVALAVAAAAGMTLLASSRELRLARAKADFMSNVTHELRSPLTAIKLHAELLRTGRFAHGGEAAESGAFIEGEAGRLGRLVDNILDFARLDSGGWVFTFSRVDLVDAALRAAETASGVAEELGVRVVVCPPDAPPRPVSADRAALVQLIGNLLDNAIKYSGGADRVEVRFGARDGWSTVSVVDSGIGIPEAERARVFERFYRVPTGLEHDVKGAGIGLAVARSIAEAHGGRIEVESREARGSTFTLILPALT